jgi:hypothetical protein
VAIIRESIHPSMDDVKEYQKVKFTCPVCKINKELKIPKSIINKARQLSTVSIPKGLVCSHHFQAFVDKNFAIRGYQKVDFEVAYDLLHKTKKNPKKDKSHLYDQIIIDGNYVEFKPLEVSKRKKMKKENLYIKEEILSNPKNRNLEEEDSNNKTKRKGMSLIEIYNEFWELIDDDNVEFKHLIESDNRRTKNKISFL